jgi:deoxyribodipyrimidine photo-lyase
MAEDAPTIVWFRRDLRVADHPALAAAATAGPVLCVWVFDPALLARRHHGAANRLRFLREGLQALDAELRQIGGSLVTRTGAPERVLAELAAETGATRVLCTREISPFGRARDAGVAAALEAERVGFEALPGDLVAEPEDLEGSAGHGYLVFTPFHTASRGLPLPDHRPAPRLRGLSVGSERLDLPAGGPLVPAGPNAAQAAIERFIESGDADRYGKQRDDLAGDHTSRLSPYLRLGMCTAAQIGRALGLPGEVSAGREAYWRQISWREFYHHHLARNPEVARAALREPLRRIRWDDDPADLAAWEAGETGYPLVDAGMRQLDAEGWMHNRARMVTASFLVKDLLVDWRKGESVFMRKLLDGDPASNNGGWQWTAGTGTDAAPYFRVLSPSRQARRFDPDGAYIRRWLPELRDVPDSRIHEPWTMAPEEQAAARCRIGRDYPAPRVDHRERRLEAVERYKRASSVAD